MKFFFVYAIFIFIVIGCSTANKNSVPKNAELMPPKVAAWPINNQLIGNKDFASIDIFLDRVAKENSDQNVIWWSDYRRAQLWAKKNKQLSCEKYSRLGADPNFPLKRLAYLRAHEICPEGSPALLSLEKFNINQFEPWLSSPALQIGLNQAKIANDYTTLIDLNLQKSKANIRKEEKINYALEALKYAKKLNDKNKITSLQKRIYNLSPSLKPNPEPKERLGIASDYKYLRKFDKAAALYRNIIQSAHSNPAEKIQAHRGLRATYKVQQNKIETLKATENLALYSSRLYNQSKKTNADAKLFIDTHLLLAKNYWTENELNKTDTVLDKIENSVPSKTELADVYWIRGRIEEENKNFIEANLWFHKALKEPIESQSFRDKINWYLAWNEYKQRNFKEASLIFKEIQTRSENNYDRSRFSFWLAKSLAASGDKSAAKAEYHDLIKEDPLSYYGLAAHRELDIQLPVKTAKELKSEEKEIALTGHIREFVNETHLEWLIALKETSIAKDYLNTIATNLKSKYRDDIESWVSLFNLYARSDNYIALFNQLGELDTSIRRTILEKNMSIIFPNPYADTVAQAASRFGISTEFIYSIMRQESSFNPQARSQMDAFGLMQLLPEVAMKSAAANFIEYTNPEDLYQPHINIPLGSAHLRELWDKYNGEIILAVAAYNASDRAISSWLKTRFRGDSLEFIEDIPYDETRDYVKLVLRNLINYQILSSNTDNMVFPEWTLKISYHGEDHVSRTSASTKLSNPVE